MVKYADYTVLCCFVFPPGFDIPTFLALFEGRQEKGERSLLQSPEAQGVRGGLTVPGEWWETPLPCRRRREQVLKPLPAACCLLLFQEADGFLLSLESFPPGRDWACWEAPGNLETKTGEASAGNTTKRYTRALPGRVASQMCPHKYSPTSSPLLMQNRGRAAFRQLLR